MIWDALDGAWSALERALGALRRRGSRECNGLGAVERTCPGCRLCRAARPALDLIEAERYEEADALLRTLPAEVQQSLAGVTVAWEAQLALTPRSAEELASEAVLAAADAWERGYPCPGDAEPLSQTGSLMFAVRAWRAAPRLEPYPVGAVWETDTLRVVAVGGPHGTSATAARLPVRVLTAAAGSVYQPGAEFCITVGPGSVWRRAGGRP